MIFQGLFLPFSVSPVRLFTSGFQPPLYRIRSGDFRACYRIVSSGIIILAITNKKDSEKILKK